MSPTVTTEPAVAAAALDALAALRRLGGTVDAEYRRGATRILSEAMQPAYRQTFHTRLGDVLGLLADCGVVEFERGTPGSGLDLGPDHLTRIAATTDPAEDAERCAALYEAAARFDVSTSWVAVGSPQARRIVQALQRQPVHSDTGRAVGELASIVGTSHVSVTGLLKTLEVVGYVECKRNSRRTYDIALTDRVPRSWLLDEPEPMETPPEVLTPEPVEPETPEPVDDEDDEPLPVVEPIEIPDESSVVVDSANAADVAFALLELVMTRARKSLEPDHRVAFLASELTDAQRRLATATEYAAGLRRRLEAASDELVAVKDERNALRQRCTSVERNLNDVLRRNGSQSTAAFRDGVQHALNRLMRELPTSK